MSSFRLVLMGVRPYDVWTLATRVQLSIVNCPPSIPFELYFNHPDRLVDLGLEAVFDQVFEGPG